MPELSKILSIPIAPDPIFVRRNVNALARPVRALPQRRERPVTKTGCPLVISARAQGIFGELTLTGERSSKVSSTLTHGGGFPRRLSHLGTRSGMQRTNRERRERDHGETETKRPGGAGFVPSFHEVFPQGGRSKIKPPSSKSSTRRNRNR
jgi:hypothetical protein